MPTPTRRPRRRSALTAGLFAGLAGLAAAAITPGLSAAPPEGKVVVDAAPLVKSSREDRFRQLEEVLPTPNEQRTASGAPGHAYWQQRADYDIRVSIDETTRRLTGSETITYTNNSPDRLDYLWVQIDTNIFAPDAEAVLIDQAPDFDTMSPSQLRRMVQRRTFDGSADITRVALTDGPDLEHRIVGTMMRIDLPEALAPGEVIRFDIDWTYVINLNDDIRARTAAERLEDGTMLFEMAHWFPRMAQYTDARGWHNKQFLGRGEFSLEFGDYRVAITVPADHIVASTGVLQNPEEVLEPVHRARLEDARTAEEPIYIVTPEEAAARRREPVADGSTRTWIYEAEMVRDFAWASSRAFAWDAKLHDIEVEGEGSTAAWCMSYWPAEGGDLWERYSTHAIMHTLDVYSRYAFLYPYPVAISVNGPVGGMEYPMICFNGPRPEKDGTYTARTKYGLIGVIIHEVGHFYFPMIVNSDERQWTWMDEGLNTFVQHLAQQEWEPDYPQRRGDARSIVPYMRSANQVPIMTNSESILQFGANAYAKPAAALNILRETVMGRELFDHAFRTFSQRWMFKNPQPADFFRTMEDASGVDLDWFWRGWFYSIEHVDFAIESIESWTTEPLSAEDRATLAKADRDAERDTITAERNRAANMPRRTDRYPDLLDFYNTYDELDPMPGDQERIDGMLERLGWGERDWAERPGTFFHVVNVRNVGGLPMPIILEVEFADGSVEEHRFPAQIWQKNDEVVRAMIMDEREIVRVTIDPRNECADVDMANNHWPPRVIRSRFEVFKNRDRPNPMQRLEAKLDGDGEPVTAEGDGATGR
jgi:hypothetical protein